MAARAARSGAPARERRRQRRDRQFLRRVSCSLVAGRRDARASPARPSIPPLPASRPIRPCLRRCGGSRNTANRSAHISQASPRHRASPRACANRRNGRRRCAPSKTNSASIRAILVSIWGIESSFGDGEQRWDVFRSLATLAQARFQQPLFRDELLSALKILQEGRIPRREFVGSWAGAMGQPQFLPSSYLKYAVDFDGDGKADIWRSVPDVLASIANYLQKSGWQPHLPWGFEVARAAAASITASAAARLPNGRSAACGAPTAAPFPAAGDAILFFPSGATGPAFLVTDNFIVLKRFNNSDAYALAVASFGRPAARPAAVPRGLAGRRFPAVARASASRYSAGSPHSATRSRISTAISTSTCATPCATCSSGSAWSPTVIRAGLSSTVPGCRSRLDRSVASIGPLGRRDASFLVIFKPKTTTRRRFARPRIKIAAASIRHVWRRFQAAASLCAAGNDLTGGAALPMFAAAAGRQDRRLDAEKADKSSG